MKATTKINEEKVIFKLSGFLRVVRLSTVNGEGQFKRWISFQWLNMSAPVEEVKKAHRLGLNDAKLSNVNTYIAETQYRNNRELSEETKNWWPSWIPIMKRGGINKIITIDKPKDDSLHALDKITRQNWTKDLNVSGIDFYSAENKDSAIDLVD
jgi:hypothetical protein